MSRVELVVMAAGAADREAQELIDRAHPLAVAGGEVVVDGDDVDAFPLDGIEVGGEGGDERLPLTGHHLGDGAGVKHHATDELDVVVAHPEPAAPCLAADAEGLGEDVVEGLAGSQPAAELGRLPAKLGIGHRLVAGFERVDRLDLRLEPSQVTRVGRAEHAGEEPLHAVSGGGSGVRDRVPDLFELFHRASFRSAGRKRGSSGAGEGRIGGRPRPSAGDRPERQRQLSAGPWGPGSSGWTG